MSVEGNRTNPIESGNNRMKNIGRLLIAIGILGLTTTFPLFYKGVNGLLCVAPLGLTSASMIGVGLGFLTKLR